MDEVIDQELMESFFTDVEETFYPQITGAMDRIRGGDIAGGVDMMLRPLHTIKGTAAFIGLAEISDYTHKVEDHLKSVQAGSGPGGRAEALSLLRCVDMVFSLLERARNKESLQGAGHEEALARLEADLAGPGNSSRHSSNKSPVPNEVTNEPVVEEEKHGARFLRVTIARVHLPAQYNALLSKLARMPDGAEAVLDLSAVRTLNSTTWGGIRQAVGRLRLAVLGMGPATRSTFYAWGFNEYIAAYSDEADYLARREG